MIMNNTIKTKLNEIGALLRSGHTVGGQARDKEGCSVPYDADTACKWSLEGAVCKVCPDVNKPHVTSYYIAREIFKLFDLKGTCNPYRWVPPTSLHSEPSSAPSVWDDVNNLWEGPDTSSDSRLSIITKLQEV